MPEPGDAPASLPRRALRRIGKAALKALGGAVYYTIYGALPNPDDPDPYWREMHPDQDKGTGRRGGDFEPPPGI